MAAKPAARAAKKEDNQPQPRELHPNEIVRYKDGQKYFGYKKTHLPDKIRDGTVPAPFRLSSDGRAKGWTGQQIIDHQRKLLAAAES